MWRYCKLLNHKMTLQVRHTGLYLQCSTERCLRVVSLTLSNIEEEQLTNMLMFGQTFCIQLEKLKSKVFQSLQSFDWKVLNRKRHFFKSSPLPLGTLIYIDIRRERLFSHFL